MDATQIAQIWNPLIRDSVATFNSIEKSVGKVKAEIAARQTSGHAYLVAQKDGRIDGFATYGPFRGGIGYARTMEHTVHLRSNMQGEGIGRVLVAALEKHAKEAGVHSLIAGISGENTAGLGFHRALGYLEIATLPEVGNKFDRWFDLVLMQKIL